MRNKNKKRKPNKLMNKNRNTPKTTAMGEDQERTSKRQHVTAKDESKIHENSKSSQNKRLNTRAHSKSSVKGHEKLYERRE